jgi:tripeptide aminopeptidase
LLVDELYALGLTDAHVDSNCYVMATLPANTSRPVPTIGFIAHLDTSPDYSGANVKPRLVAHYDGGDILLNPQEKIVLSPEQFPELKGYAGQTLIITDGTTLLGADDKAGIAEIMAAIEYLVAHPEIVHGVVKIGFTPDEEIGRGANLFDVQKFAASFAFTVDGGAVGGMEYENFNAASATVTIKGRSVHPGMAKNRMINAILVAIEFNDLLPADERPALTEGYQGFFHLQEFRGTVEVASFDYIIRDHDQDKFEAKKALMQQHAATLNTHYGAGTVQVELEDQYQNMKETILPVMYIMEHAREAMQSLDIKPVVSPIRGGTDGARLSYMGLPCPNIFTGGHAAHGRYEFIPVESMEKAAQVIAKIIERIAQPPTGAHG